MKHLLLILSLLMGCVSARAATITFAVTNSDGTAATNVLKVFPISTPILADGSWVIQGLPTRVQLVNGTNSLYLLKGNYAVTNEVLKTNILFAAPSGTGTYSFVAPGVWLSGGNIFNFTPGVSAIAPGVNITTATNGLAVTVSLSNNIVVSDASINSFSHSIDVLGHDITGANILSADTLKAASSTIRLDVNGVAVDAPGVFSGNGSGLTGVPITLGAVFVRTNGNDSTGQRNTLKAFATVEAALAVAQAFDVVDIGFGTFTLATDSTPGKVGLRLRGVSKTGTSLQHSFAGTWLNLTNDMILENFRFTTSATTNNDTRHHIFFGRTSAGGATNVFFRNVDAIGTSDVLGLTSGSCSMVSNRFERCDWVTEWDTFALNNGYFTASFYDCNLRYKNGPTYANLSSAPIACSAPNALVRVYGGSLVSSNSANTADYCASATGAGAVVHLYNVHLERWVAGVSNAVTVYGDPLATGEIDLWDGNSIDTTITGADPGNNNIIIHPLPSVKAAQFVGDGSKVTGIVEAGLGLTDLTTANVSTTRHGFAPKAPNDSTKFLDGTGAYSVPPGTGVPTTRTITVSGTANQITSSAGAQDLSVNRTWTLSTPQNIDTAANVNFGSVTAVNNVTTTSGQFVGNAAGITNAPYLASPKLKRVAYMIATGATGAAGTSIGDVFTTMGGTATAPVPTASYGAAMLETDPVANPGAVYGRSGNLLYRTGRNCYFLFVGADGTNVAHNLFLGLTDQTGTAMTAAPRPIGNYAGFLFSPTNGDTAFMCATCDNSVVTATSSSISTITATRHKFEVQFNDSIPNVVFSIDGATVGTITTHLPAAATNMRYVVGGQSTSNVVANVSLSIEGVWVQSDL